MRRPLGLIDLAVPAGALVVMVVNGFGSRVPKTESYMETQLERLTYRQVEAYARSNDAVIMPFGALEQHGPSLSLGTDVRLAEAIAEHLAEALRVLRLPVMPFGVSPEHARFAGTISLRPGTLSTVFRETFQGLHAHGFRRFIVISTHFENSACIRGEIGEIVRERCESIFALVDFWDLPDVRTQMHRLFSETGGHADATDASLMMYLSPSEVIIDQLVEEWPRLNFFVSSDLHEKFITTTGIIGSDQRKASIDAGKKLFSTIIDSYVDMLRPLLTVEMPGRKSCDPS